MDSNPKREEQSPGRTFPAGGAEVRNAAACETGNGEKCRHVLQPLPAVPQPHPDVPQPFPLSHSPFLPSYIHISLSYSPILQSYSPIPPSCSPIPPGSGTGEVLGPPHRLPPHRDRPPCPLVRGEGQGLLVGQRVVTNANESLEMSAPGCDRADLLASLWESLRSGSQSLPHQQQKGHFPTQCLLQALIFPDAVAVFQQRLFEEP